MWNSIKGYVMIRLHGVSLERMLNRMLQDDIPVWNVRRESGVSMTAELRAKDFMRLRKLQKGLRCRIHIMERHGMPFLLARARFRKVLVAGVLLGAGLLAFAQTRVWFVRMEGLSDIPSARIAEALQKEGVKRFMPRKAVETMALAEALRTYDKRIAWAGVRMEGVALCVQLVEADVPPERPDKSKPANIVAAKDGVVERVTAFSGKAAVLPGAVVRKGELLIRGDITREGAAEQLLVYAEGEVLAEVTYIAQNRQTGTQKVWGRSGKSEPYTALYVAGYPVYRAKSRFARSEMVTDSAALVKGLVLPVRLERGKYCELEELQQPADKEEALAEALFQAELDALWQVPQEAQIIKKQSAAEWSLDGSVTATVWVSVLEQIGVMAPISG